MFSILKYEHILHSWIAYLTLEGLTFYGNMIKICKFYNGYGNDNENCG